MQLLLGTSLDWIWTTLTEDEKLNTIVEQMNYTIPLAPGCYGSISHGQPPSATVTL